MSDLITETVAVGLFVSDIFHRSSVVSDIFHRSSVVSDIFYRSSVFFSWGGVWVTIRGIREPSVGELEWSVSDRWEMYDNHSR